MSNLKSVRFLSDNGDPSPQGFPCYKLVGIPEGLTDRWLKRLSDLGCSGIFKSSNEGTIKFWVSPEAKERLEAAFPESKQLSLF